MGGLGGMVLMDWSGGVGLAEEISELGMGCRSQTEEGATRCCIPGVCRWAMDVAVEVGICGVHGGCSGR